MTRTIIESAIKRDRPEHLPPSDARRRSQQRFVLVAHEDGWLIRDSTRTGPLADLAWMKGLEEAGGVVQRLNARVAADNRLVDSAGDLVCETDS